MPWYGDVMTSKERVLHVVQDLPDDASIEDAMERLLFLAKIEKGLQQADAGETVSHAQVKDGMAKCDLSERPQVTWVIGCFDRSKENPLPVTNKAYVLDWAAVPPNELPLLLEIVQPLIPRDLRNGEVEAWTFSHSLRRKDSRIREYRRYFRQSDAADVDGTRQPAVCVGVPYDPDYFEDEVGSPLTLYEALQYMSGGHLPIIMADPDSVLRLGPVKPRNCEHWSTENADTIAHFLEVVRQICRSRWYCLPQLLSHAAEASGAHRLKRAQFPDDESTMSILALIRQFSSNSAKDNLFLRSCNVYLRHCCSPGKQLWFKDCRKTFKSLLDSPPPGSSLKESVQDLIKIFLYGAGLMHSRSDDGDETKLADLIVKYGRADVVMAFHTAMKSVAQVPATVYPVLKQDFDFWLGECGLVEPKRLTITELLASFDSENV
jgi:hypothetical protein